MTILKAKEALLVIAPGPCTLCILGHIDHYLSHTTLESHSATTDHYMPSEHLLAFNSRNDEVFQKKVNSDPCS